MYNLAILEAYFKAFTNDINQWLPEDIIEVNEELLQQLHLIDENGSDQDDPSLTRYFRVFESEDKITLVNDRYAIWIVPDKTEEGPTTFTFIARIHNGEPQLEFCFVTAGVHNTSRLVLRLLEKFLTEFEENEKILEDLESST